MADLLNGIASAVGDLVTAVQTIIVATQTLAVTSTAQQPLQTSTTDAGPTTTDSSSSSTTDQTTQTPTTTSTPQTTVAPTTLKTTASTPQHVISTASIVRSSAAAKVPESSSLSISLTTSQLTSSTAALSSSSIPITSTVPAASSADATAAASTAQVPQIDHKPAIIGGVVGAIVGIVLIALLLFFCCLRRRQRRRETSIFDPFDDRDQEQRPVSFRPRPRFYREPTGMSEMNFGYAAPLVRPSPASMKSFKSANGTLIHMSLDHFTRPFSEKEGYRETVQPGLLRCTNPDRSLPVTPNLAANRMSDPFNKARPLYSSPSEKGSSAYETNTLTKLPSVHIEEASPDECSAPRYTSQQYAPSFRSYPSIHTSSPRTSRWMGDAPPPVPSIASAQRQRPKRPSLSPIHSITSRTLSSIGNALRLSSSKPSPPLVNEKGLLSPEMAQHGSHAVSRHVSAVSDPFDLDSPTAARQSALQNWQRLSAGYGNGTRTHFTTYEGT